MLRACGAQVRVGFKGAYALDYGAVLAFAAALGAPLELIAAVLPEIEPIIVSRYHTED